MDPSVILRIQEKCCKFQQLQSKQKYSQDMVAFYDVLDTIDRLFHYMCEGIGLRIKLDEKYIPLLQGYLNMFCEPAKCQFVITRGKSDDSRISIDIKMMSMSDIKIRHEIQTVASSD